RGPGTAPRAWSDGTGLAAAPDLAADDRIARDLAVEDARGERGGDREVGGRLREPHAADDVQEDVELAERDPGALLEDGEEEREALTVEAGRDTLRRAVARACRKRLDLDQERAGPLDRRRDGRAADAHGPLAEEECGGVRDRCEALRRHPEDADLVDATEPVLRRPEHPVIERSRTLEVEDRVDDVLKRLRAGDRAALRHVTDQEDGGAGVLRIPLEPGRALPDLAHVPGRAFQLRRVDRLDRVDDERGRRALVRRREDTVQLRLAEEHDIARPAAQAVGPEPDLRGRFLARDVERAVPRRLEPGRDLEQERALPDPGLAADQDERARDDAAAEHEVEFVEPSPPSHRLRARDLGEACGRSAAGRAVRRRAGRSRAGPGPPPIDDRLLDQRVPGAARRTPTGPARRLVAALRAEKRRLHLRHTVEYPGARARLRRARSRGEPWVYIGSRGVNDSKRVDSLRKKSSTTPVGPFRCFAMITSDFPTTPFSSASCGSMYRSGRYRNMTRSASCSRAPDSRRSESCGRWSERCSGARESCESAMIGTPSSLASVLIPRLIWLTSCWRFSTFPL